MITLEVPFSDKDYAKQLGASWNYILKKWTAPFHMRTTELSSYSGLTNEPQFLIPHPILFGLPQRTCWKCSGHYTHLAIGTQNGFLCGDEFKERSKTNLYAFSFVSMYFNNEEKYTEITSILKNLGMTLLFSKTVKFAYFGNICPHCGSNQSEEYAHYEVGNTFSFTPSNKLIVKALPIENLYIDGRTTQLDNLIETEWCTISVQ